MYKVLFYFPYPFKPTSGGVERISRVLGDWFNSQGHYVAYISDYFLDGKSILPIDKVGLKDKNNERALTQFIHDERIDFVINQAGILPQSHPLVKMDRGGAKLISVFHNSLDGMYSHPNLRTKNRILLKLMECEISQRLFRKLFYMKYHLFLKNIVNESDAVVLLSDGYNSEIKSYAGTEGKYVTSIGNPLTLPIETKQYKKINEIVFLGRLNWQKRPDIMLKIWQTVSCKHPDWVLRYIGDGNMRSFLEKTIFSRGIKNVYLEGTQNPEPYLKRARILCMTSGYEGFPLVLYEAMNYGVVPIVFNSFASLKDIVSDNEDGVIVKVGNDKEYIQKLDCLMSDASKLNRMSSNCLHKVKDKTVEAIGNKWIKLFEYLKACR